MAFSMSAKDKAKEPNNNPVPFWLEATVNKTDGNTGAIFSELETETHGLTHGGKILDYDCPRKISYRWHRCSTQPSTCDLRGMEKMLCSSLRYLSQCRIFLY